MTASPAPLLLFYCLAIAGFSLVGGQLPNWVRMTHTRTQLVMSLVAGLMLGVAFYHLLPHSVALLDDAPGAVDTAVWWLMLGLVGMLLLLRLFHFHQHDFSGDHDHDHEHDHGHEHAAEHPHGHAHSHADAHGHGAHRLSWIGIALGLGLHTLIDGIALGAVMHGSDSQAGLLGVGVFLAILLHKPLDAMSIVTVMEAGGWSRSARTTANLVFALLCPLGALLFFFGVDALVGSQGHIVAMALAFSAGTFICIALSDLLPEVHFHQHDRFKLTVAFLAGLAIAWAIGGVEPPGVHGGLH